VVKIKYRRVLHQDLVPAPCPPLLSGTSATTKPPISSFPAALLSGLRRALFCTRHSPLTTRHCSTFLPGSGKYVECDVTYSKQTTATFLPGATTTYQRSTFRDGFLWSRGFLTGSDSQTEFDVTCSKQTLEKILTGARTHISESDRRNSLIRYLRSTAATLVSRRLGSVRVTDWKDRCIFGCAGGWESPRGGAERLGYIPGRM
jgi:hypothetical protein